MQEGETPMAQKVYRAALRSRCGTLRVHTAALGICLIRTDSMLSHEDSLALAREIHRDVVVRFQPVANWHPLLHSSPS